MDAVSLALPTNTLAGAVTAPADKSLLPLDPGGAVIDFATLLAAGLDLQQEANGPLPLPLQEAVEPLAGAEEEAEPPVLVADPNLLLASTPLPMQPPAAERVQQALQPGVADASSLAAKHQPVEGAHERSQPLPLPLAAEAANVAGKTAEHPAALAGAQFQAELVERSQTMAPADPRSTDVAAQAAAHALNAAPAETRPAAQQPTAVLDVPPPVGSKGFADALSQQVVWMVDKDAQVAELRINPPELGPVEVRLTINGDQASAQFVSTHAEVRDALESAIARLRESFAEAGIQLGEASVGAESFREQASGQSDARQASRPGGYPVADQNAPAVAASAARTLRGLVDTFA